RLNSAGASLWEGNGLNVCDDPSTQQRATIAWDNAAGAFIAWVDYRSGQGDIYEQRVSPSGQPVWLYQGVPVSVAANGQTQPRMIADGAGGSLIVWTDARTGGQDVYAQRMDAYGQPRWTVDGMPVSTNAGQQTSAAVLTSDTNGGAIIAWP